MSEVAKMYENAGINATAKTKEIRQNVFECGLFYPEFTAEKQLKIVKLILFSTWWMNLKRLQFSEKFDEGLAQMINELWQDLTDKERTEIRSILNG